MKDYRKIQKLFIPLIVFLCMGIIGLVLFCIAFASEKQHGESSFAGLMYIMGITLLSIGLLPAGIIGIYLGVVDVSPLIRYNRDKEFHFDFILRIYATKDINYSHKYIDDCFIIEGKRIPATSYFYEKLFSDWEDYIGIRDDEGNREKMIKGVDVLDARIVEDVQFLEIKTSKGVAYIYIAMNLRKYEVILFRDSDLEKRNVAKCLYKTVLDTNKMIIAYDDMFKEIESNGRLIKKSFTRDYTFKLIMREIIEFVNENEKC